MRIGGEKKKQKRPVVGALRRGQVVTTFGCGAIADLAKESVVIAGTDYWKHAGEDRFSIYEENLQKHLGVECFVWPAFEASDSSFNKSRDIPAFRFPEWMFCPQCNRLAPYRVFGSSGAPPRCTRCNKNLIPSRFIIACKRGHMDDFPYEWWVHGNDVCDHPELYILTSEESGGLESVRIWCKTCKKSRTMAGSFKKDALKNFKCTGRRPWLNDIDPVECDDYQNPPRTLQRGGSNVYFGITKSALSIPPWSKKIQIELNNYWSTLKNLTHDEKNLKIVLGSLGIHNRCGCSVDDVVREAMAKKGYHENDVHKTWPEIIEDEYRAFLNMESDAEGDFQVRETEVPDLIKDYVDSVVLATRLREVVALTGFTRITPEYDKNDYQSYAKLGRDYKNWLPGIELRGEGIFFKINEDKIEEWEKRKSVKKRYKAIKKRMEKSIYRIDNFSSRYVLLHTLAHLLIRQLILQCGYSSSAIKERIYSTFCDEDQKIDMAGILLYTASEDSEGSLGGLVRQGEQERLENTFRLLLEGASWCSSDPLCIQSTGQGFDSLNMGACHSCTLLPETSCESRNCYLDRAAITGTLQDESPGFFAPLLK